MTEEEKRKKIEEAERIRAAGKKKIQSALKTRIDELCKEKGITYYTLAYTSTVPLSSLMHIIEGESANPGIYNIMKICDGFNMSMREFFDDPVFDDAMIESRDEK